MSRKKIFSLVSLGTAFVLLIVSLVVMRRFAFEDSSLHVSFILGFLLILGYCAGKIFSSFSLPQLSGFLFVGMILGPSFLSIIGPSEINALTPLNELALALIAVQAGSEISMKFLKGGTKSILLVILCQSLIIMSGMTLVFLLCIYVFGFDIAAPGAAAISAALIFATLSISKAPADTLAILGETKLRGKFANHILGVVVLIDILVIILFQFVLLVVKPYLIAGAYFDSARLIILAEELISSLAAGFSVGLIFILWFSVTRLNMRQSILFLILASFGIASMCHYLHYDALIVFIVGGFVVSNMSKNGHALIETVETMSHGVMIVFFASAGAMLDLQVLKTLWPYALILSFSRIIFTAIGTICGHLWAKDDFQRFKYSFSGYISQAGVTLVLAQAAAKSLGDLGQALAALATAVVAINEIVGPVAFKLAIRREQKNNPEQPQTKY